MYKDYAVREESNLHDNKSELYGIVRYLEEEIVLNAGASLNQKKATLIHEIIHAIDEIWIVSSFPRDRWKSWEPAFLCC